MEIRDLLKDTDPKHIQGFQFDLNLKYFFEFISVILQLILIVQLINIPSMFVGKLDYWNTIFKLCFLLGAILGKLINQ